MKSMDVVGIVGLGLIGGSMAKAISEKTEIKVLGADSCADTIDAALKEGAISGTLDSSNISQCDCVIVCLYPQATVEYVNSNLSGFAKDCIVFDTAGVKTNVCKKLSKVCASKGVHFIGGHPMAGTEKSGFENSFATLFDNATMIFCQDEHTDPIAFGYANKLFKDIGFGKITTTTASEHDRMIAFTSQLPHVISNAYIQSDTAQRQLGFTGGSFRDLTRVAYLNEEMWGQLFLENKQPLVEEIRSLAGRLEEFATLIEDNELTKLKDMLRKGKDIKSSFDEQSK